MPSILLAGPAVEPLTLAEAKDYLRVETADDDDVITALVAGARTLVEAQTRRALITQTWRLVRDAWPEVGRLQVLPAPLRSVAAARYYDADGGPHAIDTGVFLVDSASSLLAFPQWSMPAPGRAAAGIEIDVGVGYGDTSVSVPEPLRQAVRMLVAHWYEHRGLVAAGRNVAFMPAAVAALISPFRVLAL
jgi:uncharacterized phiE125 gp8 family phage protein